MGVELLGQKRLSKGAGAEGTVIKSGFLHQANEGNEPFCAQTEETTKYTEYTKHERVMRGILLTLLESILAAPNLCPFVSFVSFVVPIALSRLMRRGDRSHLAGDYDGSPSSAGLRRTGAGQPLKQLQPQFGTRQVGTRFVTACALCGLRLDLLP